MVRQGIYEHYKSTPAKRRYYQVLFLSHYEETLELMVQYIPLYELGENDASKDGIAVWTRTLANFEETVEYNGAQMPRFKRIDSTIQE